MKLNEFCELAFRQLFPNPGNETKIKLGEFIATGKGEYAYNMWLKAMKEKSDEGSYEVPSNILVRKVLPVVNKTIDISKLGILKAIPNEMWLQRVGDLKCECHYVKSTINNTALFCGDDSLSDDARTFYVQGNVIQFPEGTHANDLPIVYASDGTALNGEEIEIDESIGAIVRNKLIEIYGGKTGQEDLTNNTNPEK